MKWIIDIPEANIVSLRKLHENGIQIGSINMAIVNGVPYEPEERKAWIGSYRKTFWDFAHWKCPYGGQLQVERTPYCTCCGNKVAVPKPTAE